MTTSLTERRCEHCASNIGHKRRDARFCDRACKMARWHASNRGTTDGRKREQARNTLRYAHERPRRQAYALAQYREHADRYKAASRAWRRAHPERRRTQADVRALRMRCNPGFAPYDDVAWLRLKRRHEFCCAYCNVRSEVLEQDHVIPLSRGGRHAIANILPACPSCNRAKGSFLLVEWRLRREGR